MKKLPSLSNLHSNLRNSRGASKSTPCWRSSTLICVICAICGSLSLASCSHTRYIPLPEHHSRDSLSTVVHKKVNNTYVDRTHTLVQRGDTVFRTDSIYVEKFTDVEVHDTITVTHRDSIPYPVEVPIEVEKPIPRFYKNCTAGFFLILLCIILYVFLRIYLRR